MDLLDWYNGVYGKLCDDFGDMYEGLLQKNVNEIKFGVGQYFILCLLIKIIIYLLKLQLCEVVQDLVVGIVGFLIEVDCYVKLQINDLDDFDGDMQDFQIYCVFIGFELVFGICCLVLMNCLLYDIEGNFDYGGVICLGNILGSDGENLLKVYIVVINLLFGSVVGINIICIFVYLISNK